MQPTFRPGYPSSSGEILLDQYRVRRCRLESIRIELKAREYCWTNFWIDLALSKEIDFSCPNWTIYLMIQVVQTS